MKILNFIILFFLGSIFSSQIIAQTMDAKMIFDNEKHNFGKIKEVNGKVEHKFVFSNMGAEPIVIADVRSSCGCTTPSWSKEPVPPGGKGFVKAVYNPYNRPGAFHKTITIKSNAENNPITLHINGDVIAKPKSIETEYKYAMGPIRMKKKNIHISEIYNDAVKSQSIRIINTSDHDVTVTFNEKRSIPRHLTIVCKPETLKPNEKGIITFTYNAKLKNDYGYVYDRIYFSFNHDNDSKNRINVSTVIKEKFTQEMIDNPPVLTMINEKTYDFGTIQQGGKIEHVFKFKNTGKNDLIIRKTKASCGCTAVQLGNKVIPPGQEGSVKAVFNTRGKRGKQHKSVTVTTNIPDVKGKPKRSEIILMLKGTVEVPNTGDK